MNESPTEIRRRALQWTNDAGEYTPASTLMERIDGFISEKFAPLKGRRDTRPQQDVQQGSTKDTSPKSLADYARYRNIHFSKAKCCKECPYCNRARKKVNESIQTAIADWAETLQEDVWSDLKVGNVGVFLKRKGRRALLKQWPMTDFYDEAHDYAKKVLGNLKGAKGKSNDVVFIVQRRKDGSTQTLWEQKVRSWKG